MQDFDIRNREYREYVEAYLEKWYKRFQNEPQKPLFKAMEYSLLAGGKRLRPVFVLEFCNHVDVVRFGVVRNICNF